MNYRKLLFLNVAVLFFAAGCGSPDQDMSANSTPDSDMSAPQQEMTEAADEAMDSGGDMMEDASEALAARLAAADRSAEDRARDAGRKPAQVLTFFGVQPGMDVIDLMAADGWYTEVLSIAVGPDGSVTAQNPPWMLAFRDGAMGTGLDKRITGRLDNVTRLDADWDQLAESGGQYDFALSALNFHDVFIFESPEAAAKMAAAIYDVLKPGAVLGVIDHAGNPDADNKSLHRIPKATVIDLLTGAGFELEAESNLLANPADDHTQSVFSEGIRGKTDRFILKMRKPAM